jgi:integrase
MDMADAPPTEHREPREGSGDVRGLSAASSAVLVARTVRPPTPPADASRASVTPIDPDRLLSDGAAALVARGLAANTRAAYERHWGAFQRWCHLRGRTPLPATAETLAEYVAYLTGTTTQYGRPPSASTINHVLGCLQAAHKHAGQVCDVRLARLALRGYRRDGADADAGDRPSAPRGRRQSAPITLPALRALVHAILAAVGAGELHPLKGQRDQVALVLAFAMAGRASEVAALDIADLAFSARGLTVTVRASKTDQDAAGTVVHIKYGKHLETCPVRLTEAWIDTLAARGITDGPLLRGVDRYGHLAGTPGYAGRIRPDGAPARLKNDALNAVVRDAVRRARATDPDHGLDGAERYSWHGLRAGFATAAAEGGAAPTAIADHGRWKGLLMVMHYWRGGTAWANNALDRVDL